MKVVVVYESMYGNTHLIAEAIGEGLRASAKADVAVIPVDDANMGSLEGADLVVIGGPTHAHGMSRTSTRMAAVEAARKQDSALVVESHAEGPGLRDWFESLGQISTRAAAFDTRVDLPAAITGRASKRIARELRHHGCATIAAPESFLVSKQNHLVPDEEGRAREWGASLAAAMAGPESARAVHDRDEN